MMDGRQLNRTVRSPPPPPPPSAPRCWSTSLHGATCMLLAPPRASSPARGCILPCRATVAIAAPSQLAVLRRANGGVEHSTASGRQHNALSVWRVTVSGTCLATHGILQAAHRATAMISDSPHSSAHQLLLSRLVYVLQQKLALLCIAANAASQAHSGRVQHVLVHAE